MQACGMTPLPSRPTRSALLLWFPVLLKLIWVASFQACVLGFEWYGKFMCSSLLYIVNTFVAMCIKSKFSRQLTRFESHGCAYVTMSA